MSQIQQTPNVTQTMPQTQEKHINTDYGKDTASFKQNKNNGNRLFARDRTTQHNRRQRRMSESSSKGAPLCLVSERRSFIWQTLQREYTTVAPQPVTEAGRQAERQAGKHTRIHCLPFSFSLINTNHTLSTQHGIISDTRKQQQRRLFSDACYY